MMQITVWHANTRLQPTVYMRAIGLSILKKLTELFTPADGARRQHNRKERSVIVAHESSCWSAFLSKIRAGYCLKLYKAQNLLGCKPYAILSEGMGKMICQKQTISISKNNNKQLNRVKKNNNVRLDNTQNFKRTFENNIDLQFLFLKV